MVRVAGVQEQVASGYQTPDASGLSPKELLPLLTEKIKSFSEKQYSCFTRSLLPALKRIGISFAQPQSLDEEQQHFVRDYFEKVLFKKKEGNEY